jgi:3-oxoacyl-[acyl-carrier protein] reductase
MDKKVIIVTGANGDIGSPLVNCLIQEGYQVGACVRERAETNLEENRNLKIFNCNFSNKDSIKACISEIKESYKNIYGLVNCVGIAHGGSFMMTSIDDINEVFSINYFSVINFSQQIIRKMIKKRSGSIINLASTAAILSDSGTLAYGSSKAALIHSSKVMAKELGPFNIRVNSIAPAVVESKMANMMDKTSIEALENRAAISSKIYPSEVVDMIIYLLSDSSVNITGQVIKIDRGITD